MIKVIKQNNLITISGHANSDVYGKDIVCASVSSIVYTTINALMKLDEASAQIKDESVMEIKVLKNDEITNALVENMMDLLKDLAKDYPKNVSVKES